MECIGEMRIEYRFAPRKDVSFNDGPHIRRCSHKIIIYFFVVLRPNAGHGLLSLEVSRSQTTTHYSQ